MNACIDIERGIRTTHRVPAAMRTLAFVPLILFPLGVFLVRNYLQAWEFMWLFAFAIFAGCKWLNWVRAPRNGNFTIRDGIYLFLWPGLNAVEFLNLSFKAPKPKTCEWIAAFAKTLFGGLLLWVLARMLPAGKELLAGWCGLLGLIFLLHFGTFHLLALIWQRLGINAEPLMRAPILATSLSDFWGRRWNTAFSHLVHGTIFRKGYRRLGASWTLLLVFFVSGLIHELVISLPARGEYGLPTFYFVAQGFGLLLERSNLGKRFGLGKGFQGWCFTALLTAGPAFYLFHPPFVLQVIIPFMKAIHAL